eukprot:CAMPEP_0118936444 /NCGR_PEP_ID=MMETSP1169-20130426/18965_1 /TAXON_ID=36882 /ORGANISM="Pyramimonas obovata, Strain CCMP722" /LENGTH=68 /DNA_ID=CAMNT_0006879711 /DNA_START=330 /DNA_END=533 /DNA_ORIENTATION=-
MRLCFGSKGAVRLAAHAVPNPLMSGTSLANNASLPSTLSCASLPATSPCATSLPATSASATSLSGASP